MGWRGSLRLCRYKAADLARRDAVRYREIARKIRLEDLMTAFQKLESGEAPGEIRSHQLFFFPF
jgi:hypothetical protein